MKRLTKLLKRVIPFILTLFLLTGISDNLHAQRVNKNSAEQEARQNSRDAGFEKIFFSSGVLNTVLSNASSIKFYNGLPNGENRRAVLMAIGLDGDGNEIGTIFRQSDRDGNETTIDLNLKNLQVANAENSNRITAFSSTFGSSDISDLLSQAGVSGLHIMPASNDGVLTMTAIPATGSAESAETMSLDGFKSPCPPDCGGQ